MLTQVMNQDNLKIAMPLFFLIVAIFGLLALACIVAGGFAICGKALAETAFDFPGFHLKSGHVGVALIGIGLATAFLTIKAILKKL
jgi:hypothetical protein